MSSIRRLITDRDVLLGRVTSPIVLDDGTLLTPAARDRAMVKGLRIVERGEQATPVARGTAPDANCGPGPDGCAHCGQSDCTGCAGGTQGARSSRRAQAAPACADGLADGLYLVRIEGGRRVSVQPAAGQGLMRRAGEVCS